MQTIVPERKCHALQFLLFIKAMTACEASAYRATFARAALRPVQFETPTICRIMSKSPYHRGFATISECLTSQMPGRGATDCESLARMGTRAGGVKGAPRLYCPSAPRNRSPWRE